MAIANAVSGPSVPNAPATTGAGGASSSSAAQTPYDQIAAQIKSTPASYRMQAQYNPQFAALNSTIAWQNLFGSPDMPTTISATQTGWYDAAGNYLGDSSMFDAAGHPGSTTPKPPAGAKHVVQGNPLQVVRSAPGSLATAEAAQPRLLAMQTASRTQDIADVAKLGPAAYGAMRAYDPTVTGLYDTMGKQTQSLLDTNGALDPFLTRALQQNYRGAEASRGMAGGTGDAAMEAYYLAATQEQRRLANLNVAGTVAGETAGYYGDPFVQVLGRTSGGVQVPGMTYTANQPSGIPGQTNSTLSSSTSTGANQLLLDQYQAQVKSQNAKYNQQQQGIAGLMGLLSPSGSGGLTGAISGLGNYFSPQPSAQTQGNVGASIAAGLVPSWY
jgi:hypothetical protein